MINLKACINNDLANNYGNLCQRVFSFLKKNCNNKIPKGENFIDIDTRLIRNTKDKIPDLIKLINKQNLNEYMKTVISFSFDANKYFNDSEPWKFKKTDAKRMNTILFTVIEQIKNISILLNPIIPLSTKKVLNCININEKDFTIRTILENEILDHNKEIKQIDILFKKIENDN